VSVSGNGVTSGCIIWYNIAPLTCPAPPATPPTGTGNFSVQAGGSSGIFNGSETGTIQDLSYMTAFPVVDFLTLSNGALFDLIDLRPNLGANIGDCTIATGSQNSGVACTPAGSPFTITNGQCIGVNCVATTATISFTVDAEGYTGTSGTNYSAATAYVGNFSTTSAINGNINQVLATIEAGNPILVPWIANFSPVASPEPATFGSIGIALVALGMLRRRYTRNS